MTVTNLWLKKQDGTLVPVVHAPDASADVVPPGVIAPSALAVEPEGWLFYGQTVVGGETAHPDLWAVAPALWKSGADLVLPGNDSVMRGAAVPGPTVGVDTFVLPSVPAHTHTVADHSHAMSSTSTGASVTHTHVVDHTHAAGNSGGSPGQAVQGIGGASLPGMLTAFGTDDSSAGSIDNMGGHSHLHVFPSSLFDTDNANVGHTHTVAGDLASGGGLATSSVGAGEAIKNTSKYLGVQWMVKT